MPHNLKEEIIFTLTMAGLMVLGMTFYNVIRADGLHHHLLTTVLSGYWLALLVALIADTLIIGPIAKKVAFKLIPANAKPIQIGLTISAFMVLGMVTIMSFFGIAVEGHIGWENYVQAWLFNVIVALPLQLFIVGNIARALLAKIQSNTKIA